MPTVASLFHLVELEMASCVVITALTLQHEKSDFIASGNVALVVLQHNQCVGLHHGRKDA